MACSNRNLLVNGGFRRGVFPWKGKNVYRIPNPLVKGDYSVVMGANLKKHSLMYQTVPGPLESGCAYYLYFRVLNRSLVNVQPRLIVSVAYLNSKKRLLRSTPLIVLPPRRSNIDVFHPFFTIVPPPPSQTRYLSVIFITDRGTVLVDYISIASHEITKK